METRAQKIREIAKKLLAEGKVKCVIGFKKGTVPMRDVPYFAYTPEEAENLTWSSFCANNLANFTIRREGNFAVCAQGCASRNLVGLIKENQYPRESVYVIGVPCLGMVDRRKVAEAVGQKEITEVTEAGEEITVKGPGYEQKLVRKELLRANCLTCQHRNPVIADELVAEKVDETMGGNIEEMASPWDKLSSEERWAAFEDTIKDCIRCNACRDACPLCYCHVCFVDEAMPQWCGKTQDEADVATFHILRAFHCAGRCTDCGACESACPVGIKMRRLTSKIEKDVRSLYGYEPGIDLKAEPPMNVYRPNDPQDFIK
ncbi:MAG: 4Fe-4S ferredoxin [Deltaproteobacteria bacterium]|nr:4Fe-4S ferredoxin [Deltaproteobacteria bacterium]